MDKLRREFLEVLKVAGQKQLVAKSGTCPEIAVIRDDTGKIISFSSVERLGADHPMVAPFLKAEKTKSAEVPATDNSVFDSLFFFPAPDPAPAKLETAKSNSRTMQDDDDCLNTLFPMEFLTWPI